MLKLSVIAMAIALAGCASTDYEHYANAQKAIAEAKAQSDEARFNALATLAGKSDATGVAAVMAIALGQQSAGQQQVQAPPQNQALSWAQVLVPALTQAYAIGKSADVAINSSNNAALTSSNTTAAFVGIAGKIQAPVIAAPVTPQANVTTSTTTTSGDTITSGDTLSGTGVLGSGAYSTQANPVTTITTTTNPAPVIVPDVVQIVPVVQITPVITP